MIKICILAEKNKKNFGVPIIPKDIKKICNKNNDIQFYFEPSKNRIIDDREFLKAGCKKYKKEKIDLYISINSTHKSLIHKGMVFICFTDIFKKKPRDLGFLKKILNYKSSIIDLNLLKDKNKKNIFKNIINEKDNLLLSKFISKKLSSNLNQIIKNINKDSIEEVFIIKKGYLNYRYINLVKYLI